MWNNTNPAELFSGTTWELLTAGKYIQSGSTALSTGGSNSISISKANLPAVSIKVNNFSLTQGSHGHRVRGTNGYDGNCVGIANTGYSDVSFGGTGIGNKSYVENSTSGNILIEKAQPSIGTASPYTENLGSGTALNIQPEFITLKFWKRLT